MDPKGASGTGLVEAIHSAGDIAAVGRCCRRVAEALGFPLFQYGFRVPVSYTRPCQIILSGYPNAWRKRYDECGYLAVDPVVQRALGTVMPFGWDELQVDSDEGRRLFAEAATHGLVHGFSAPVHGAHGEGALFSFARAEPLPQGAERAALFTAAQTYTGHIHERLRALVHAEGTSPFDAKPLTARERECLRLAADGLHAPAIAQALSISEHTVVFHLANAETKLGARSRQHAVARAVALGEIAPRVYPDQLRESHEFIEIIRH